MGKYVILIVLGLAACGTSTADRAITGGAIGAGVGGAGAAILGQDVGAGVLLGGVVGAATGGLTDPGQIDLGEPVYRR